MYKIYIMLHYFASINERYKLINSEMKRIAQERIAEILKAGVEEGSFEVDDIFLMAKQIHNTLVGYLISNITEVKDPRAIKLPHMLEVDES